jgi:hypothetical protein
MLEEPLCFDDISVSVRDAPLEVNRVCCRELLPTAL